jgi:nucleoside-diphosphate-sugar epimerase
MRVLVTGANGFLGRNVVQALCGRNYRVRAMIRPEAMVNWPDHPNVEVWRGRLGNEADSLAAVENCDAVMHCAADTSQAHLRYADYLPVNVDASLRLFRAACAAGCRRFVFVSTANTLGYGSIASPGHEGLPASPPFDSSGYARSKMEAENALMTEDAGILVIVNPTFLIGPDDARSGSEKLFRNIFQRRIVLYPPGGKNFVDVRDAAAGAVKAMEQGRPGERYLLSGHNLAYADFFRLAAKAFGQAPAFLGVPRWFLISMGFLASLLRAVGMPLALSLPNAWILCVGNYYTHMKAREELGVEFRPLEETLGDVAAAYGV